MPNDDKNTMAPSTEKGLLIAHFGQHLIVEDKQGEFFHCHAKRTIGPLVTGDWVEWHKTTHNTGVITALLERQSVITKFDKKLKHKPIIANVDQLVIVVALNPKISLTTIDRYFVIAEYFKLRPVLVINKWDLHEEAAFAENLAEIQKYQTIIPDTYHISAETKAGFEALQVVLQGRCSLLAGQSGVGKSSLIRALIPNLNIRTSELSRNRNLGKHTTSASQLYHLPEGGDVIDSPGIRQFYLHHLDREAIIAGFPEFEPFWGKCQFRNCNHIQEPGCAIQQAVEKGLIQRFRLENLHALLSEQQTPF